MAAWAIGARSSAAWRASPWAARWALSLARRSVTRPNSGAMPNFREQLGQQARINPARLAAMLHRRDQLFAICVVVLSAKLAKCDGPVKRQEIDAFKRQFRIPPEAMRDIGHLFDQARDSPEGYQSYAAQLGDAFADNRGMLEDVLTALFALARADGPVNGSELEFLSVTYRSFGLDQTAWDRAAARPHGIRQPTTGPTPMRYSAYPVRRKPTTSAPPGSG